MVCIRLLLVIHCHCKTGSMQVERLQYVPWVEHCGSEVQETERRGSGMAAKAGEPTLNTWMRSDKASCRVFTDSVSPFPLYHPNFFLSLSVCFSLWFVAVPSLRRALCGGDRGWYECLGWKNGPTALGISLLAAGLCEREKGHFQAGEVSANISCQSDSGPQLE